ncbi:MAG: SRPBCC domain-containing protein [Leptolyngbyaceae cyanobacterium RM1_405_57]|nr:SRPBCC domain-containing protein [Leptolyngbyaceae cyanobacterium RM1_405_57]
MSHPVYLEVFYPYPPERVWQVLTDRRALATWMMENDFEPKLGHKFQFYNQPLPGLKTTIQCEVMELEEPTRLVYTWQDSPTAIPSLVIWTLNTVTGGTQLRLKHHQSYTTAVATSNRSNLRSRKRVNKNIEPFCSKLSPSVSELEMTLYHPSSRSRTQFDPLDVLITEFSEFQSFTWDYFLHQRLPSILAQDRPTCS